MTWYVVFYGRKTGVFSTWRDCHQQVNGFKGACFKGYNTEEQAWAAYHNQHVDQAPPQFKADKELNKTSTPTKYIIIIV